MKKIFLLFFLVFVLYACTGMQSGVLSENSVVKKSSYKSAIVQGYDVRVRRCDEELDKKNSLSGLEVWQMRNNFSEKLECYKNIINDIIGTHYSGDSEIQKNSDEFVKSAINVSHSIYGDAKDCYPSCGTMTIEQGQITNLEFIQLYIKKLLEQLESKERMNNY